MYNAFRPRNARETPQFSLHPHDASAVGSGKKPSHWIWPEVLPGTKPPLIALEAAVCAPMISCLVQRPPRRAASPSLRSSARSGRIILRRTGTARIPLLPLGRQLARLPWLGLVRIVNALAPALRLLIRLERREGRRSLGSALVENGPKPPLQVAVERQVPSSARRVSSAAQGIDTWRRNGKSEGRGCTKRTAFNRESNYQRLCEG